MATNVDESASGSFECNICLDTVHDPVVTLCGHLYCWPCIYKWIQHQEKCITQCPVCKTEVSENTIVPLYGPTQTTNHGTKEKVPPVIPPRPTTPRHCRQGPPVSGGYQRLAPPPLAMPGHENMSTDGVVVHSPTIGMLGEMACGRILGELESPLFGSPNSYNIVGNSTPRERWQTTQTDRSLTRIYGFFICCIVFCLLTFT